MGNVELRRDNLVVSQSLDQESKRALDLQQQLKDLKNPVYVEELARTRLGMIKKGETAYKVMTNEK